jgi:hypothetical protein
VDFPIKNGDFDGNIWWEIVGKYDVKYCDEKYDGNYYPLVN